MIRAPFPNNRAAALALLGLDTAEITHKEAGFLGHVCVAAVLTDKQGAWLSKLLARNGLPTFEIGGAP